MMPIPKGTTVTQVVEIITGVVTKTQFNESTEQLEYLVEYTNAAGENHTRWFQESQITVVLPPVAEVAPVIVATPVVDVAPVATPTVTTTAGV